MTIPADAIAGPVDGRPLPLIDGDTAPFFEAAARGVLCLQQCVDTGLFQYYPRPRSIHTGGEVRWVEVSGRGTVYSFSIARQNYAQPGFHAIAPYVVAMIDLDEGVRVMGNIVGVPIDDVAIGLPVEVFFACVEAGGNLHLPFWRPAGVGEAC